MSRAIDRTLRRFIPRLAEHLSDDRLAQLFCHELALVERLIARRHLAKCWQCRVRQEDLEGRRADRMLDTYRDALEQRELSLTPEPREDFARQLDLYIQQATPRRRWKFPWPHITRPRLPLMNPALVTCMVFAFATILSFYFWWHQRAPRISSNALLVRAEKWDTPSLASSSGIVYQAIRITVSNESKKETVSRSIYRDTQGKRKPRQVKLDRTEEQLRSTLAEAGLDWDEPLSASGYQNWHDHQHVREDHIARAGNHLLRLTTTVPEGVVAEQSLTVRDTDFHPVLRTVELRDSGTVEIAELDFKILPWNAVDDNVFEPLEIANTSIPGSPARVLSFPRLPQTLTEGQLDETELGARLMLNQLHADTGEQLEIHRSPQGVSVAGVVDTEEQKRNLQDRLRMVPHVSAAIQTVAEASAAPVPTGVSQSVAIASMPDFSSPLQTYLREQGHNVDDINNLGQRLFQNAVVIAQESKDINDLQSHFGSAEPKTAVATATLSDLIYSHHERLEAALKQERELLAATQGAAHGGQTSDATQAPSLQDAANRNLALAKELTQTHSRAVRDAGQILNEMSLTLTDLTTGAREAFGKPQSASTLSGKK
jgi:hypothetical protein